MNQYYLGIDLGSSFTKAVLINSDKKILAESFTKTSSSFEKAIDKVKIDILKLANISEEEILCTVATGVGRKSCKVAAFSKPEINCLSRGAYYFFPKAMTVVDIGGQDNKIIRVAENGKQLSFKMNRKCASGTGSFLEEMSYRLDIPSIEMNKLATQAINTVGIGSFCTVFAGTEVIHHIREGHDIGSIVKGIYESMVKRIFEIDSLEGDIILTGGAIAHAPILETIFSEKIDSKIQVPKSPQCVGATGAALYAFENNSKGVSP